jgi:hypothetical protein
MSSTDGILWAYVALVFVSALALIYSRWPQWAKAVLVICVSALYFVGDAALNHVWGWPGRQALPERFVLLAAVIEEPTKKSAGALYVWLNALENGKPVAVPRAYALPYSKDLHSLLNEGMKKARQGITQLGTAEPKAGTKGLAWLRPGNDEQTVTIKDLPAPQLPEK